eukprot:6330742-Prymnesium_polylepis.1
MTSPCTSVPSRSTCDTHTGPGAREGLSGQKTGQHAAEWPWVPSAQRAEHGAKNGAEHGPTQVRSGRSLVRSGRSL